MRFVKFAAVLAYAGGAIGALVARDLGARRTLVHRVASPGLMVVWGAGVTMVVLGALALSLWLMIWRPTWDMVSL